MSSTLQNDLPGIPVQTALPAEPVVGLNNAKAVAAHYGVAAVSFLAEVVNNPEYDITERVQAAAELLQFLAKGPF